jgi:hypothetical protein
MPDVAPEPIDVYHLEKRVNDPDFPIDARNAYKEAVAWDSSNVFRKLYPDDVQYTYWALAADRVVSETAPPRTASCGTPTTGQLPVRGVLAILTFLEFARHPLFPQILFPARFGFEEKYSFLSRKYRLIAFCAASREA